MFVVSTEVPHSRSPLSAELSSSSWFERTKMASVFTYGGPRETLRQR